MIDLSQIKNKKLRELIENSLTFSTLPEDKQETEVSRISRFSIEIQEIIYVPYFEHQNASEEPIRKKITTKLVAEFHECEKKLDKLEREDLEEADRNKEEMKTASLLKTLKNL